MFSLIPTILSGIVLIFDVVDTNSRIASIKEEYTSSLFSYDVGASFGPALHVIGLGLIILLVHVFMYWHNKPKALPNNMGYGQPQSMPNQNMNYD